mgnify:CR=1 FL=1
MAFGFPAKPSKLFDQFRKPHELILVKSSFAEIYFSREFNEPWLSKMTWCATSKLHPGYEFPLPRK